MYTYAIESTVVSALGTSNLNRSLPKRREEKQGKSVYKAVRKEAAGGN